MNVLVKFLPMILQLGRDWSHCPSIQFKMFVPTSSPFVQFTIATVPSVKSALLNVTFPFVILLEKSQQLSEIFQLSHQLKFWPEILPASG